MLVRIFKTRGRDPQSITSRQAYIDAAEDRRQRRRRKAIRNAAKSEARHYIIECDKKYSYLEESNWRTISEKRKDAGYDELGHGPIIRKTNGQTW